jgi:hypothetical protein
MIFSLFYLLQKMFSIPPSKKQKIGNYTFLFHGNCIDGWFSAYIAHAALKYSGNIDMYPISPSQTNTWPKNMSGTHILLLDVSVQKEYRDQWIKEGALSVNCIDHHATSIEHWPENCPINTESCAALQTWTHFYPTEEIPLWLHHIDRIDRWDNPTYEDRCIREVLNTIAHKPVEKKIDEAFQMTEQFLQNVNDPDGFRAIVDHGIQILVPKDAQLKNILSGGAIHRFTEDYINGWKLPAMWFDLHVFIIDNTGITFDTTEAAHLAFEEYPHMNIFINYRKKYDRFSKKTTYTYSARSRDFDITEGTILKGHPNAAGATLVKGEHAILPFLLTPP